MDIEKLAVALESQGHRVTTENLQALIDTLPATACADLEKLSTHLDDEQVRDLVCTTLVDLGSRFVRIDGEVV
jgi:hypothetical protein